MIIVTTDEKKYVHEAFKRLGSIVVTEKLDVGDIVVNEYVIERKQINDFYSSMLDGRLFKQMESMMSMKEDHPELVFVLVIEGRKVSNRLKKFQKAFNMMDILVNILVVYGVIPFITNSVHQTVDFAQYLHSYTMENKKLLKMVRAYKGQKTLRAKKKYALMGFPTIGDKRAEAILENYNTLMEYFQKVEKGKFNKIKEVLTK